MSRGLYDLPGPDAIFFLGGIFIETKGKQKGIYFKVSEEERDLIEQKMALAGVRNMSGYQGLSQQKCIEKIWQDCSPQTAAKLLDVLCAYFEFRMGTGRWTDEDYQDYDMVQKISERLRSIDG